MVWHARQSLVRRMQAGGSGEWVGGCERVSGERDAGTSVLNAVWLAV